MTSARPATRSLTPNEMDVLRAWLSRGVPDAERVRAQLESGVEVYPSCDCGCPSIGFVHSDPAESTVGVGVSDVSATVLDANGDPIGGIAFFTKGGELHDVDVYTFFDNFEFPALDRVRFD